MSDITLVWSAMGGMFLLFIAYVVWQQKQLADISDKMARLDKATSDMVNNLRIETNEKVASIDKKQDVEFAQIKTQLAAIMTKLTEIQTEYKNQRDRK